MRKIFTLILVCFIAISFAKAQTILFTDSFETYTTGGFLAQQATPAWTTWSNQPGGAEDATISETFAHSYIKSLKIASTQDDIILPLGNKTSGRYNVSFWYYIPTGFGGYFNMQHYQNPGIQWATEVYFGNNGNGNIQAQGITTNFTHANNAWIHIENIVDIDLDTAWFFIDGVQIVKWKFSTQASGSAGAAQLGGIDFYGGAITGQTPTYYVDDVTYTEINSGLNPPSILVSTDTIITTGQAPETFTVTNTGNQDLNFISYITYPYDVNNITNTATINALTHVQSAFASGLGFNSSITAKVGTKFFPADVNPIIGQSVYSVTLQINDVPTNPVLLIYDRGSFITPGPGTLLVNKPFTATTPGELIEVPLDAPIYLDGKDLWIGYEAYADSGLFPYGLDGGPRVASANWFSNGPGWSEYNATIDANLFIAGNLQGNPVLQWLSVSPTTGTILGLQNQTMTLSFNTTGLTTGNYHAVVQIGCNDPTQEFSDVDVFLTFISGVNNNNESVGVMTFPNPVTNNINIVSNNNIEKVILFDYNGKEVNSKSVNNTATQINVEGLAKGNYLMQIYSGNTIVKRKIIVK